MYSKIHAARLHARIHDVMDSIEGLFDADTLTYTFFRLHTNRSERFGPLRREHPYLYDLR